MNLDKGGFCGELAGRTLSGPCRGGVSLPEANADEELDAKESCEEFGGRGLN